ncbi:hypothetical protein ACS0PU_005039 [Formica fusca]
MHCGDTVRGSSVLHVLRFARSCTTLARNLFFEEYIIQYPMRVKIVFAPKISRNKNTQRRISAIHCIVCVIKKKD